MSQCVEMVHDGGRSVTLHRCHNQAKEGHQICGVHLAAIERRKKARAKYEAEWDADKAYKSRVEALAKETGLTLKPNYSLSRYQHDEVVMNIEEFLALYIEAKGNA